MIENLPTEKLYDSAYVKMMDGLEAIRTKQLSHGFEINMLGTGSRLYSISDSIFSGVKKSRSLRRYVSFLQRKYLNHLVRSGKLVASKFNVIWTKDAVTSSTLPYPVRRVEYPWAFFNAKLDGPAKILDVGSGISIFPAYLALQGHEVYSIDNDDTLMEKIAPKLAEWSGTRVNYSIGDAINIKFGDNTFDTVFCISVLEHLEEEKIDGKYVNYRKQNLDIKAINEMLRVLKPGGLLVLTFDWSESPEEMRSYKLADIYDRVLKPYRPLLLQDKKPDINWDELKNRHIEAWKAFPPYDYVYETWSMGAILRKK